MSIFDFIRNKIATFRATTGPSDRELANIRAREMGVEGAEAMMEAVNWFIIREARTHADTLYNDFLRIADECAEERDRSPIDMVRINFKVFLERINNYRDEMRMKCVSEIADWMNVAKMVSADDILNDYINQEIGIIHNEIFMKSLDYSASLVRELEAKGFAPLITKEWK